MTNEVKEVKGVMILNDKGGFWSNEIYTGLESAESEVIESFADNGKVLFSIGKKLKFVTVTAKIEITGPAV